MKKLPLFSLALLCFICSCETESDADSGLEAQPTYRYNTDQQYTTTESFTIDFEDFNAGAIVSEIAITDPFENAQVSGITMAFPDTNAAMIFDSSNPTGGDFDLGTPNEMYGGPGIGNGGASNNTALGNVLILSEDLDADDPDDIFEVGASFVFDFSANAAVKLNAFDILDIEDSSNPPVVTLFDLDDNVLFTKEVTPGGDNSKMTVDLEQTANVAFMEIIMNSSGAIDNISLEMEVQEACVECDSAITELTFKYAGDTPQGTVQIQTADGTILFDELLDLDDEFTITGNTAEGIFEGDLILIVNDQMAQVATDCSLPIGPGFFLNGLFVVSGVTQSGGQLCPVEIAT
jgi:hypothetical protein